MRWHKAHFRFLLAIFFFFFQTNKWDSDRVEAGFFFVHQDLRRSNVASYGQAKMRNSTWIELAVTHILWCSLEQADGYNSSQIRPVITAKPLSFHPIAFVVVTNAQVLDIFFFGHLFDSDKCVYFKDFKVYFYGSNLPQFKIKSRPIASLELSHSLYFRFVCCFFFSFKSMACHNSALSKVPDKTIYLPGDNRPMSAHVMIQIIYFTFAFDCMWARKQEKLPSI